MCLPASCARDKETCVYKGFFAESAACVFESSCAQCVCLKRSLHGPQDGDKTYNCCSGAVFMGTGCVARWRSDVEIHDHEHDHLRSRGGRHERHNESGRDQHKTTRGHQNRSEMTYCTPGYKCSGHSLRHFSTQQGQVLEGQLFPGRRSVGAKCCRGRETESEQLIVSYMLLDTLSIDVLLIIES